MEFTAPPQWSHVNGAENLADFASKGLLPSELLRHNLWRNGPNWLILPSTDWPRQSKLTLTEPTGKEREVSLHLISHQRMPIISIDHYSNYTLLKHITAWVLRFINNCHARKEN